MNIVFLSASGQLGGAETSLLDILASVRQAQPGWKLGLISCEDGPLLRRANGLGVETRALPFPQTIACLGDSAGVGRLKLLFGMLRGSAAGILYVRRLRRVLRDMAPQLIHSNGFKTHVLSVWAGPRKIPVIWHVHDYVRPRFIMARLLRAHVCRCAAMIANSHSVAGELRGIFPRGIKIHPVYNGVDLQRFSPVGPRLDLDALSGLPLAANGIVRVGLVATFARWKGHGVFLHALALLPAGLPIRAYVIGGPIYQTDDSQLQIDELRGLARELGISDKVGFTGFVEEPAAAMRALDIVVHASTQPEPFGLVITEAMACGRAVIASQAGGAAELIAPGKNALAHLPGDAGELARCISELVLSPRQRAALGVAGQESARTRFDRGDLARQLIPIYREAAAAAQ